VAERPQVVDQPFAVVGENGLEEVALDVLDV
jgi:hypothetical protein